MARLTMARKRWTGTTTRRKSRVTGSTTARGYGHPHQQARDRYVAAFRPGQPCAIGAEPLWHHTLRQWCDLLDLAHDHTNGGYLGLACRTHNRQEPSLRRQGKLPATTGRRW